MTRKPSVLRASFALAVAVALTFAFVIGPGHHFVAAQGGPTPDNPTPPAGMRGSQVSPPVQPGLSRPLRLLPRSRSLIVPANSPVGSAVTPSRAQRRALTVRPGTIRAGRTASLPQPTTSFNGIGCSPEIVNVCGNVPPDITGAIGPNDYVELVNSGIAVFSPTGATLMQPAPAGELFSTLDTADGNHCASAHYGDGVVVYDHAAGRFVVTLPDIYPYAVHGNHHSFECVAVSATSNPLGAWHTYDFEYAYAVDGQPKIGVWPDGYYLTYDMYNPTTFVGTRFCVLERAAMLTGAAATQQCFMEDDLVFGVLPASVDGSVPPPAGAAEYLLAFSGSWDDLWEWRFHVDWTTPANSTLSHATAFPVTDFSPICLDVNETSCIPQPSPGNILDGHGESLMYPLEYRNFGAFETLLASQTIATATAGIRWYELKFGGPSGAPMTIYDSGQFDPNDGKWRWLPSAAMDKAGDIGVGYSVSGPSTDPSIGYAGRLATDPHNLLAQGEHVAYTGTGVETGTLPDGQTASQWGGYTSMAVDPTNGCTFWYANAYYHANGISDWRSRIFSFTFPSCVGPDLTVRVTAGAVYGTTPNLANLPANSPLIAYSPSAQAAKVTGTLTCSTSATATSHASTTPYGLTDCSGLTDPGYVVVYDYINSGYTVSKAAPALAWKAPAAITYGAALSPTQLDATSSIAGRFTYSPAAGSLLKAGNDRQLTATFTPTDVTDYEAGVHVSTKITVTPAPLTVAAKHRTVSYGQTVRHLKFLAEGLVAGDTAQSLKIQPKCTTSAHLRSGVERSPAGSYAITCAGAADSNYTITYRSATLSVIEATPWIAYTGAKSFVHGSAAALSATLKAHHQPVTHRHVVFKLGSQRCAAHTSGSGTARCTITSVNAGPGLRNLVIRFRGDPAGTRQEYGPRMFARRVTVTATTQQH